MSHREQLQYNIQKDIHKLEIDFEDLDAENKNLSDVLTHKPGLVIPLVSFLLLIWRFLLYKYIVRNSNKRSVLRIRPE